MSSLTGFMLQRLTSKWIELKDQELLFPTQPLLAGWWFNPRYVRLKIPGPQLPCPSLFIGFRFCARQGKLGNLEVWPLPSILLTKRDCHYKGCNTLPLSPAVEQWLRDFPGGKADHKNRAPKLSIRNCLYLEEVWGSASLRVFSKPVEILVIALKRTGNSLSTRS